MSSWRFLVISHFLDGTFRITIGTRFRSIRSAGAFFLPHRCANRSTPCSNRLLGKQFGFYVTSATTQSRLGANYTVTAMIAKVRLYQLRSPSHGESRSSGVVTTSTFGFVDQ